MSAKRRALGGVCAVLGMASTQALAQSEGADVADVWVCALQAAAYWGSANGTHALSIGTTAANGGNVNLDWIQEGFQHPVIAQNLYRLKDGVLEQVGMSWVKHGFCAVQQDTGCGVCQDPFPVCLDILRPGCSDPYSASLNSMSDQLGPRSEVNATTAAFLWPHTVAEGTIPSTIRSRLQVAEADILPTLNPGARWFAEGQYLHPQDAASGMANNNATYRELDVAGFDFTPNMPMNFIDSSVAMTTMIEGWASLDPTVQVARVDLEGEGGGRFTVASRAADNGDGTWSYEYAVHNMNADRSASSFSVPIPDGVTITSIGFHDVEHHSGEPYSGDDWPAAEGGGAVTWSTDDFATDPNANAIRWGTMFNFRFIANTGPAQANATVGFFKPGMASSMTATVMAPAEAPCVGDFNGDGVVNGADLATTLSQFGGPGSADIDNSGSVDGVDIAFLLANWGSC